MQDVAAVVLAGGEGRRLAPLTWECCKPALPFAARHRTIDFTLSNCLHSSVPRIALLAQYRAESLLPYIHRSWRERLRDAGIRLESFESDDAEGFKGTADAVAQVLVRSELLGARRILVLAGDHVYRMDYRALLRDHAARGADVTVACVEVAQSEAQPFGVVGVDENHRITTFVEKPKVPADIPGRPGRSLVSMGIYVFEREALATCLREGGMDFGRDILPQWLGRARIVAHRFQDAVQPHSNYWRDVGTIDAYWQAHMELLSASAPFETRDPRWSIGGGEQDAAVQMREPRPLDPERANGKPRLASSAMIRHSVIFPGAVVEEHAVLEECIVLPGASIGRAARLRRVIVGSDCRIPDGTVLGGRDAAAGTRSPGGITVLVPGDLEKAAYSGRRSAQHTETLATVPHVSTENARSVAGAVLLGLPS